MCIDPFLKKISALSGSKFDALVKREDITKKRTDAGVQLESQEVIETIEKEYWA